jgi:hypothetical protein
MSRNPSPQQIRSMAALAFRRRARQQLVQPVRRADVDETPLSVAEVAHGVQHGLIASHQTAPERAFHGG